MAETFGTSSLGILGGSFDPIHNGHLYVAEQARAAVSFNRLIVVPASKPPHKCSKILTSAHHRLEMIRRAVKDRTWMEVDESEILRGGISYTVDTVQALGEAHPKAVLFFIIGSDSLEELWTWRAIKVIAQKVKFITVRRSEEEPTPSYPKLEERLGGTKLETLLLEAPPLHVSSTEIRHRVARGDSIDGLVPAAVAEYIAQEGLYR